MASMAKSEAERRVLAARRLSSSNEAKALYRDWALTYDSDVADTLGFTGGKDIASMLVQHVRQLSAPIVDIGCGTGLVGEELTASGYLTIDGIDLLPEMLAVARSKGIYRHLVEADLNLPLDLPDDSYSAAVSAGTFTSGHVGADRLEEILRIIRPEGLLACVIADDVWRPGEFEATVSGLIQEGKASVIAHQQRPITLTSDATGQFLVLQVTD